tara:strand:+ start:7966 stop:8205 length:240 start_codon:yes stop_codon:yes gene_type:complete
MIFGDGHRCYLPILDVKIAEVQVLGRPLVMKKVGKNYKYGKGKSFGIGNGIHFFWIGFQQNYLYAMLCRNRTIALLWGF